MFKVYVQYGFAGLEHDPKLYMSYLSLGIW